MKRSMVLDATLLERLTGKPDYENIVIGTGALARDMRKKLPLLGLKAPFLIGGHAEPEKDIRHYSEIAALGDPKRYRFILCCDTDEWELIAPAQMAAYSFLGITAQNHPQMIRFFAPQVLLEHAGNYITDAMGCNILLRDGHPYAVYGQGNAASISETGSAASLADTGSAACLHIHILGNCHGGGLLRSVQKTIPELLHNTLNRAGLPVTIHAWGQPESLIGDDLIRLVRDVCFQPCDLLLYYSSVDVNPLTIATKNMLATSAGSAMLNQPFIRQCQSLGISASNGIDHNVDLFTLRRTQQRIFNALSKLHGFSFWDVLAPNSYFLSEHQARVFKGRPYGYYLRQKQKKDALFSVLDARYTKDYTEIFADVDDIRAMFVDALHLSDEGVQIVTERLAADILKAFKQ